MCQVCNGYSLQAIPWRVSVVPDVLEVQVVPSKEVSKVPDVPTATNETLEVVVVLLSSLLTTGDDGETNNGYENYM